MAREVPQLEAGQWNRITEVLMAWSEVHPRPHLPVLQLADGSELTPGDIGRSLADPESWTARLLYRAFAASQLADAVSPAEPLEEILADFELDIRAWRSEETLG